MARLLHLMRSGEVRNLLGFHTNSIVEEVLPKNSSRRGSLWAGQADKGGGWKAGGGMEDEREAGHNANCHLGGAVGQHHASTSGFIVSLCVAGGCCLCNTFCWKQTFYYKHHIIIYISWFLFKVLLLLNMASAIVSFFAALFPHLYIFFCKILS